MLKGLKRYFAFLPSRLEDRFGAFIDSEREMLHRKMRKIHYNRTTIDFENIPELFAYTRNDSETIKNLWTNKKVAGVVLARDEFPEENITHKARDIFDIYRDMQTHNGTTQPYMLSIDDDKDYFKVTINDVHLHAFYLNWPMFMAWNRFIPGRPNRMKIRVVIENWESSEARLRGGRIEMREDHVWVDVFTETYPRVIKANFMDMIPGKTYTIRELERDLPDGIQLAPEYAKRKAEPLFIVQKTLKSYIYWQYLKGRFDVSKFADIDLASMNFDIKDKKFEKEGTMEQGVFLSKSEEEKMRKLATMLGKSFDELKKEIIASRLKKTEEEAKKAKPPPPAKK